MSNELSRLHNLKRNLISYENAQHEKTENEKAVQKCSAEMNFTETKHVCEYERRKYAVCTSFVALLVSLISSVAVAVFYILFCIADVENGTDILLSPKGTVDAGEIVLAVIFGIIGTGIVWCVLFFPLLPVDKVLSEKKRDRYDQVYEEERLEAQRKDQEITDRFRDNAHSTKLRLLEKLGSIQRRIDALEEEIEAEDILPAVYKTETDVSVFIRYFEQRRVNNIQEAINLYVAELEAEKRHQQLLALQRESNAYVQAAARAAQISAVSASSAASQAASAAESASSAASQAASAAESASSAASAANSGLSSSDINAIAAAIRRA